MADVASITPALDAIERFFEALAGARWETAAEMVDSKAAAAFRESELASLTGWAQHRDAIIAARQGGEGSVGWSSDGRLSQALLDEYGGTPLRGMPGVHTLAQLVALSARAFVAKCLEVANTPLTTPSGERIETRRRVLGGIGDGDAIVHVLFRVEGPGIEHTDPLSVEIVRLRQSDNVWRVDLTPFNFDIASARSLMMFTDLELGAGSTDVEPSAPDA